MFFSFMYNGQNNWVNSLNKIKEKQILFCVFLKKVNPVCYFVRVSSFAGCNKDSPNDLQ